MIAEIVALVVEWLMTQLGMEVAQWVKDLRIRNQAKQDATDILDAKTQDQQAKALDEATSHTTGKLLD